MNASVTQLYEQLSGVRVSRTELSSAVTAIERITHRSLHGQKDVMDATLATGSKWRYVVPGLDGVEAFVVPLPDQSYVVGLAQDHSGLQAELARRMERPLCTSQIAILTPITATTQGIYYLDANWLLVVLSYYHFHNAAIPNGDALAYYLATVSNPLQQPVFQHADGMRLTVRGDRLGPYQDELGTILRSYGCGTLRGQAGTQPLLGLVLESANGQFACEGHQQTLRAYSNALLGAFTQGG